ncbi:arginyl-tRNA synthetase [Salinibacterium sp. M195]|uniref:arginyl-tRNA synthetase n=1 Tax=Salinibacterium sp. M195 TaxID=2583374 RepID=UPI001C62718E|nr:arginyl-tRNA synthetase [Salinibacterium sp. M195]QYH36567.1 arginyl-tRNA synthetase [Salinibacterium sp. M195]
MALQLRVIPAAIALSASALLLSACVPTEPEPTSSPTASSSSPTPTSTPTSDPTSAPTAAPEPAVTATPDAQATPVTIACTELISPQAIYDFNPNYVLLNSFTPAAGSPAASALQSKGTACRWQNGTSGITIDVSVAKPTSAKLASLKSAAGAKVSEFDGYFTSSGGTGTAQVFSGSYWMTLSSAAFDRAAGAAELVTVAKAALK